MKDRYKAGVVGGGYGGRLSLDGLAKSSRFDIVGVADLRKEVCDELKELYPQAQTFLSYQEMFEKCELDVVCVSTYAPSHCEITLEALKLGLKGLLVEKPLGDTAGAGRKLLDAIKEQKLPVVVPHGLLMSSHGRKIIDHVRNGDIGRLSLVEIECDGWDIINAGIHWLNFFVALTGNEPLDYVMAACDTTSRTYRDGMQVETLGVTYAQTKSGVRVVMNTGDYVNIADNKGCLFRLVGTAGTIEFWGWENSYRLLNSEHPEGKLFEIEQDSVGGHQRFLDTLAEQIDSGSADYEIADSSLMALELCEGAYISSRHGCSVSLPLDQFVEPAQNDWDPGIPYKGTGGGRDGRKLPPKDK